MATLSYNKQKSPWRDCDITELGLTLSVHGYLNVPLITVCLQQVLFITLAHYASNYQDILDLRRFKVVQ